MTSSVNGGLEQGEENFSPIKHHRQRKTTREAEEEEDQCQFHIGGRSLTGVTLRAGSEDSSRSYEGDEISGSSGSCFSGSQSSLQLFSPTKSISSAAAVVDPSACVQGALTDSNNCLSLPEVSGKSPVDKGEKEKFRPKTLAIPGMAEIRHSLYQSFKRDHTLLQQ